MQVTIQAAKIELSELIERAKAGEEVIIADGRTPVAKIVPMRKNTFKFGVLQGQLPSDGPDFFQPMEEDELGRWEGIA